MTWIPPKSTKKSLVRKFHFRVANWKFAKKCQISQNGQMYFSWPAYSKNGQNFFETGYEIENLVTLVHECRATLVEISKIGVMHELIYSRKTGVIFEHSLNSLSHYFWSLSSSRNVKLGISLKLSESVQRQSTFSQSSVESESQILTPFTTGVWLRLWCFSFFLKMCST